MSRKFRFAFGRFLSCGKNRDFYGRWPYCRTHTTYATASTALPSTATLNYQMNVANTPKTIRYGPSNKGQNDNTTQAPHSTLTYFEVVVDSPEIVHSCPEEVTQL